MRKLNPGYKLITIPKGTYPKQDKDVQVIGFFTHIVASCKLPADEVYTMTKTIADNTKTLATVAKDIGKLSRWPWPPISACRSIPAPPSSTRKPASP